MKKAKRISALAVFCVIGAALTLTGCWKDILSESNDLQFSASYSIGTKAVYGVDVDGFQQILWQGTDDVRISSDYAVTLLGRHFSDYNVTPQSGDSDATKGKISRKATIIGGTEDSGLRWVDNASGSANFWSTYPASAMTDNGLQNISFTIPNSTSLQTAVKQPSGSVVKILDPVNGSYPMVAYASGVNANSNLVKLSYYPAFTSFQITLLNDSEGDMMLNYCSLTSDTDDLCGTFTAPIVDLAQASPVTSNVSTSATGKTVSAGLNQPLHSGESVTFSIFCLPTDLTNLTLACNFTDENGTQTKTLALNQSGEAITFAACKQHRINLRFKGGTVDFEMTRVIALIVTSTYPDQYEYRNDGEVYDRTTGEKVGIEELREVILSVKNVTITNDHGIDTVNYVNGMFAFTNLETLTIDGANSINSVTVEGLPHFKKLNIIYADAIRDVTVSDCPWTESVSISTRSLNTITLNNLTRLKNLTVNEGGANSNLETFTLTNCYDLETAYFGEIGALKTLNMSGCNKMTDLHIGLAYQLQDVDLTGCTSLKSIYINKAQSLPDLDVSDCAALESIEIRDAQQLRYLIIHDKPHLRTVNITSTAPKVEIAELVNLPVLSTLVFPTEKVLRYTMTNCDSITGINWSNASSLSTLELSDNDRLESIILTEPTKLTTFNYSSNILKTLKLNGSAGGGVASMTSFTLNAPNLTTLELANTHALADVSLINLPSVINDISVFVPSNYNATRRISLTNCSGFTNIDINPASSMQEMHFNSCANLRSVTLRSCWNNTDVWNNPPTTNIVATKSNCPNLNSYYTVINGSNTVQFNFN